MISIFSIPNLVGLGIGVFCGKNFGDVLDITQYSWISEDRAILIYGGIGVIALLSPYFLKKKMPGLAKIPQALFILLATYAMTVAYYMYSPAPAPAV